MLGRRRNGCIFLGIFLITTLAYAFYLLRPDDPELFSTRLNQVSLGVESRVTWWDWKDTEEEIACRNGKTSDMSKEPIPNVVHFVLLATDKVDMSYKNFLSIKATLVNLKPDKVKLHSYGIIEENKYWQQLKHRVELVLYDRYSLRGPHDKPVDDYGLAHQADFLRLAILQREGGIYLDSDIYPFKPFTELLHSSKDILMGHEGGNRYGFGNAVIIARAKSEFLQIWRDSYKSFGWSWNYHSIRMPKLLQVKHPDLICPLSPTVFFWPTWAGAHRHYMYDRINEAEIAELQRNMTMYGGAMYENQLAIHQAPKEMSDDLILGEDSRFYVLLRDVVRAKI